MTAEPDQEIPKRRKGWRRWLSLAARVAVGGVIVWWLVSYVSFRELWEAIKSISLLALVPALFFSVAIVFIGGLRWRAMMRAFGAEETPPLGELVRLFFVGLFYNTYLPGGAGGDVVRGVVTRRYFTASAGSYVVVVLERLIGLAGMGLVFVLGLIIGPHVFTWEEMRPWLLVVAGLVAVVAIFILASGKLSHHLRQLPGLRSPGLLAWSFGLSLASHFCGITVGYALAVGMDLPLGYAAMVLVVPVALTMGTFGGIGPREVTLVALFHLLGINSEQAVALSLAYGAVTLATAGVGGVIQLVQGRVGVHREEAPARSASAASPESSPAPATSSVASNDPEPPEGRRASVV